MTFSFPPSLFSFCLSDLPLARGRRRRVAIARGLHATPGQHTAGKMSGYFSNADNSMNHLFLRSPWYIDLPRRKGDAAEPMYATSVPFAASSPFPFLPTSVGPPWVGRAVG